jgi:hypothetical protein
MGALMTQYLRDTAVGLSYSTTRRVEGLYALNEQVATYPQGILVFSVTRIYIAL